MDPYHNPQASKEQFRQFRELRGLFAAARTTLHALAEQQDRHTELPPGSSALQCGPTGLGRKEESYFHGPRSFLFRSPRTTVFIQVSTIMDSIAPEHHKLTCKGHCLSRLMMTHTRSRSLANHWSSETGTSLHLLSSSLVVHPQMPF